MTRMERQTSARFVQYAWSKDRGLVMRCYDRYTDHENTICTEWDYGARSIDMLATLHDLVGRTLRGEFN